MSEYFECFQGVSQAEGNFLMFLKKKLSSFVLSFECVFFFYGEGNFSHVFRRVVIFLSEL